MPRGTSPRGDARDADADRIRELYARGLSIQSVATEIGRSYGYVHNIMCQYGIPRRPHGVSSRSRRAEAEDAESA